ncbi:hypothetical protein C8J57DRAFT_1289923 [Mycena rebaudengoi]|nr:hypothetical protein C8J57DRAFT_1289923 [Mycena rebaudengoi]
MLVNDAPVAVDIETEHAPTVSSVDTADETLRFDPAAEVIGGHLEPLREDSGPLDALVNLPAVPVVEAEPQLSEVDTAPIAEDAPIALGINPPVSDDYHKAAIESGVIVDPSTLHDPDAQDDSPDPSSDAVVAALIESGVLADQPEQADANPDALLGAIPESFEDHPNEDVVEDLPWSTAVPEVEPKKVASEPEGLPTREDVVETDRSTSSEPPTIQTSLATGYSAPERPISPWTSSYSVTNQGRPSEAGAEDVSDHEVFEEQNHLDEPIADSTSLDASLEPPRASSPWTRSYSVSVQGSPLPASAQLAEDASVPVSDHEVFEEHDHMGEPIPDSASLDASLEPPRASSPWTPSYSVSVQGSPLPTSAQLTADVDKEDTPVVHDASAEFSATREIENIAEPPTSSVEDISDFIAESVAEVAPIAPTEESSHGEATSDVVIDESLDSTSTFASTVPAHGEFEPIHADPAVLAAVPVDSASGDASAELEPVLEQKATTLALQDTLQGVADSGDLSADLAAESVPAQAPKDVITGETSSAVDAPAAAATATPADSPGIPVIVLQDVPHMEKEAVPVLEQTVDDAAAARANGTETVNMAVEQDTKGIATTQLAPSTADQIHDTPLELSVEPPLEVTEPLVSSETVEPHGVVSHSQDSVPAPVEHINSPPAVAPEADAEISTPPTSETPKAFPLMLDVSGSTPDDESVLDPPLSPRSRLESTASSMFFPGGWFSKVPEGRASFDVAQGEFSQPKSPKIPSIPPPTASPTAPPTAPPAAETRESEEKKGKWCVVM